jgi:glycerophosphoryl diester phosphodiesterase
VQVTADGHLVTMHDDTVDRTTDGTGRVGDLTLAQVKALRTAGGHEVPTLAEVVDAFPDARLNIDAKTDASCTALIAFVQAHGLRDRVCLASFSDRRIRRMAGAVPGVYTNRGRLGVVRLVLRSLGVPVPPGPGAAQVPARQGPVPVVTRRLVRTAHDHGVEVHVWTIDDEAEMDRLLDLDVDGIITDRPSVLKAVLERRRMW